MSKKKTGFSDLIKKARIPEYQNTRIPESQIDDADEMVNLGVKVSLKRRRHWAAESKRKGVSMTDVIIRALVDEFGEPE